MSPDLKTNGTLWAWGYNIYGQLGNGTTTNRSSPVQIGSGWQTVSAGYNHSLAIKTNATLWAWGGNYAGQLGDGTAWEENPVFILNAYIFPWPMFLPAFLNAGTN